MFIVLEVQKNLDGIGSVVTPIPTFETKEDAESCWHNKLAYACISQAPIHTVILMDDDANTIRRETYLHQPQPNSPDEPDEAASEEEP